MAKMRKLCLQQETDPLSLISPCPTLPSLSKEGQPCRCLLLRNNSRTWKKLAFKSLNAIRLQKRKKKLVFIEHLLSARHYFNDLKIISLKLSFILVKIL